ncbi:hypothetical protein Glove_114g9 [Diversispora epigaea]|uniref:Uncharacterized protein n=1 Tax=Diversispora epigaea TaxID=1348612 RepID=A0A397J3U7_9GLOM|nr:hypothetical protein Glove_114g9 [Diversispora epigaea]
MEIKYSQDIQDIGPITITQNVVCASCKEHISGAEFMRQLNSDIIHVRVQWDLTNRVMVILWKLLIPPPHTPILKNRK